MAPQGKPISNHRLFPAIVALWMAALLGLSSLAIHPRLLESLVIAAHIDRIIPAATPPLGITARILLGLVVAAPGALLGLLLGCRLAQTTGLASPLPDRPAEMDDPVRLRARDMHPDAPARRPFSAQDEIGPGETNDGETGEDEAVLPAAPDQPVLAARRRSFALPDHDQIHDLAPLPGGAPLILNIADLAFNDPAKPATTAEPVNDSAASGPGAAGRPSSNDEITSANLVSLVDRLARSMERRRMRSAAGGSAIVAKPEPAATQLAASTLFEHPAETEIELRSTPLALPDSMRPVAIEDEQDNAQEPLGNLPTPRMIRLPSLSPAAGLVAEDINDEQFDEDEDAPDRAIDESDGYSSLLNLSRLTATRLAYEQVASEPETLAEPVVIFPGQAARVAATIAPRLATLAEVPESEETTSQPNGQPAPAPTKRGTFRRTRTPDHEGATHDPDETEEALRTALSSLQRMSGAA